MNNLSTESNVLQLALSSANAGTFLYQATRKHLSWDDRSSEIFGVSDNAYKGDWSEWEISSENTPYTAVQEAISSQSEGESLISVSYVVEGADGITRAVKTIANVIRASDDEVIAVSGIHVDLSEKTRLESQLEAAKNQAKSGESLDLLTKTLNKTALLRDCETLYNIAARYEHKFSVIQVALDHPEELDERHEPSVRRSVLVRIAEGIHDMVRDVDIVGRLGPNKFLVILPETHPTDAGTVAHSLKRHLSSLSVSTANGLQPIRASLGVAGIDAEIGVSLDAILEEADNQITKVQSRGGNDVGVAMYLIAEFVRSDMSLTRDNEPAESGLSAAEQNQPAANHGEKKKQLVNSRQ